MAIGISRLATVNNGTEFRKGIAAIETIGEQSSSTDAKRSDLIKSDHICSSALCWIRDGQSSHDLWLLMWSKTATGTVTVEDSRGI